MACRNRPGTHNQALAEQLTSTEYVRSLPATETGSPEIEAYEFRTIDGSYPLLVAWTNDNNNHVIPIGADYVVVVDKMGDGTEVRDGDDGQVDGRVRVALGPSPLYLRFQPGYGLTITTAGSGTVLREPDKVSYRYGDLVTLALSPLLAGHLTLGRGIAPPRWSPMAMGAGLLRWMAIRC